MFARSWSPRGVVLVGLELAYTVTDTPIKALRRVIPPLRLGGVALDVSFLVVLLAAFWFSRRTGWRSRSEGSRHEQADRLCR
ncbi:MAG: YggT family protein [Nocardioides sp.]